MDISLKMNTFVSRLESCDEKVCIAYRDNHRDNHLDECGDEPGDDYFD